MTHEDIETLIKGSFLARVPAIMLANPSIAVEDAIQQAYNDEEKLCTDIIAACQNTGSSRGQSAITMMAERIYTTIKFSDQEG